MILSFKEQNDVRSLMKTELTGTFGRQSPEIHLSWFHGRVFRFGRFNKQDARSNQQETSGNGLPETFSHTTSNVGWVNTQWVGKYSWGIYPMPGYFEKKILNGDLQ
ncbi:hypothetical protein AVEN_158723-1 [Araneus ventricosus]|uniref:Uncharacterized protein n=1 Tax=Araneus ventricosus TaxID=182803 RepID=A0A4Y2WCA0_ARAVE|nr:hypothetical protein AVEN_158723-1 [Araneus ventricosus]